MQKIKNSPALLKSYLPFIKEELYEEILELSKKLQGARILFLNATKYGGGVAEILQAEIPLLNSLGINVAWENLEANEDFYKVTKAIHNSLQGEKSFTFTVKTRGIYESVNEKNAKLLSKQKFDLLFIHDPQPMAIPFFWPNAPKSIWRCHIQISPTNPQVWDYLKGFLKSYESATFSLEEFIPKGLKIPNRIVQPAINPLSPKNKKIDLEKAEEIIKKLGLNTKKSIISQISRFDPWKDPLGVIQSYRLAKKEFPDLQLILAGSAASDDPENFKIMAFVKKEANKDKNIKIFSNLDDIQINAIQTFSKIILQKSLREGFGLTVAEALYKETPVIGGDTGGIRTQIFNGKDGYLVKSVEECGQRIIDLLNNNTLRLKMGKAGKTIIADKFLLPRLVRDELSLFVDTIK
ncbi:glycosyl transferase family 1 [bacterium CG_4_10_14_0_2_um_filter_33_32]|nr:MAG: glycosyl transferase family 1 [bacterium CG_4_10_14_0_2_um_filter_33_32]